MRARHSIKAIAVPAVVLFIVAATTISASAGTGTATISGGTLAFISSPSSISFAGTLNNANQNVTATQAFDIGDATGSGTGWNVTATSTTFTTGGGTPHLLSTTGTTVQASPTVACDASVTCTTATTGVSYPYTLPAAATAPTATKLYNATANTGMANQSFAATFRLAVPASTYAGTYTSTWTYSLVSGP